MSCFSPADCCLGPHRNTSPGLTPLYCQSLLLPCRMSCNMQTSQRIPSSTQSSSKLDPQQTQESVEKISWGIEPCRPSAFVCEVVGTVAHLVQIRKSTKGPGDLCPKSGPFFIGEGLWAVQSLKECIPTHALAHSHKCTHTQRDIHSHTSSSKEQFVGSCAVLHVGN